MQFELVCASPADAADLLEVLKRTTLAEGDNAIAFRRASEEAQHQQRKKHQPTFRWSFYLDRSGVRW